MDFVPGPDITSLPSCMRLAIQNSMAGTQSPTDDANMLGLGQPIVGNPACNGKPIIPYCQQAAYANTVYCACQNSSVSNPVCLLTACQNSPAAYKSILQRAVAGDPKNKCPDQTVCISTTSVGGSGNVVQASQTNNCGSTIQQFVQKAKMHPAIVVVVIILVILLAILSSTPSAHKRGPPPGSMPDDGAGDANPWAPSMM